MSLQRDVHGSKSESNHRLLGAKILLKLSARKRKLLKRKLNLEKQKIQTVKEDFCLKLQNQLASLTDCDEDPTNRCKKFQITTEKVAAEVIGYAPAKTRNNYVSEKTVNLIEVRRQASNASIAVKKVLRKQVRFSLRQDRQQFWDEVAIEMEKAARNNDTRRLFRTFNEVTGKNSPIAGPLKDAQGSVIPDVEGKLDHSKNNLKDLRNANADGQDATPLLPPTAERPPYGIDMAPPSASEILSKRLNQTA